MGLRNTTTDSSQQQCLDQRLQLLYSLSTVLGSAQSERSNLQSNNMALDRERNLGAVQSLQASPTYQTFNNQIADLQSWARGGLNGVERSSAGNPSGALTQMSTLEQQATARIAGLRSQVQAQMSKLQSGGQSPDVVRQAYQELLDRLTDYNHLFDGAEQNFQKLTEKLKGPELEARLRANKKELTNLDGRARTANDPLALSSISDQVTALLSQRQQIQDELYTVKSDPTNPDAQQELKKQIADSHNETEEAREKWVDTLNEEKKRIAEAVFQDQSRSFQVRSGQLDAQISLLEEQMKNPTTTSDKVKELIGTIDRLIDQRTALIKQQNQASYQRDLEVQSKNSFISVADPNSVQGQLGDAVNRTGRSDRLPFLLQLAQRESSFNPNAAVGSHRGLFQIAGASTDIDTQVSLALSQLDANRSSFTKSMGRAPTPQEEYLMWNQGAAGGQASSNK